MEATLAHRIMVVLHEYEWEFENALVEMQGDVVHVWYEDEDGSRERIVTAPASACLIEWVDLGELSGAEMEEEDGDEEEHEHHHHHHPH